MGSVLARILHKTMRDAARNTEGWKRRRMPPHGPSTDLQQQRGAQALGGQRCDRQQQRGAAPAPALTLRWVLARRASLLPRRLLRCRAAFAGLRAHKRTNSWES